MTAITVIAEVTKACPFKEETDVGTATFHFTHDAPELHGLARYLLELAQTRISHEDYTRMLRKDWDADRVTTTWQTAGLQVIVTDD